MAEPLTMYDMKKQLDAKPIVTLSIYYIYIYTLVLMGGYCAQASMAKLKCLLQKILVAQTVNFCLHNSKSIKYQYI